MRGGVKFFAGAPAAVRHYVEADRGRADDYYLAEGTGIARRYTAGAGSVEESAPLTGSPTQRGGRLDRRAARGRRADRRLSRPVEIPAEVSSPVAADRPP
jgi:hypothetical protein